MEVMTTKARMIEAIKMLNPNTATATSIRATMRSRRFAKAGIDELFTFWAHDLDLWMFA